MQYQICPLEGTFGMLGGWEEWAGGMLSAAGSTAGGAVGPTRLQRSPVVAQTNKPRED